MKPYKVTVVVYLSAPNSASAEGIVTNLVNTHSEVTGCEVTYVREDTTSSHILKPAKVIPPMSFEDFSIKYSEARNAGGDPVGDITKAYAVYCVSPAGHFLHKE